MCWGHQAAGISAHTASTATLPSSLAVSLRTNGFQKILRYPPGTRTRAVVRFDCFPCHFAAPQLFLLHDLAEIRVVIKPWKPIGGFNLAHGLPFCLCQQGVQRTDARRCRAAGRRGLCAPSTKRRRNSSETANAAATAHSAPARTACLILMGSGARAGAGLSAGTSGETP